MRKTKGFSYDPIRDKDVINHIDKQPNGSQYIWSLVRKDMKENDFEELIKKQIQKYLQERNLVTGINTISIDKNDIEDILNL